MCEEKKKKKEKKKNLISLFTMQGRHIEHANTVRDDSAREGQRRGNNRGRRRGTN